MSERHSVAFGIPMMPRNPSKCRKFEDKSYLLGVLDEKKGLFLGEEAPKGNFEDRPYKKVVDTGFVQMT